MSLESGARLGSYEILDALGAGGMGEVYRARDNKLGREVAVKVLPPAFASDEERLARFEREARLLASLNHPGIATLHGIEDADDSKFLVMELVTGETLAERLARGALPIDEALSLFRQIAEAVEAAHRHGVIHRDLKPANIKITPEGKVKVLDFGLAKAFGEDVAPDDLSQSPTAAYTGTRAGVILGTAPYMSPEQARGKPIDKRTDVWSFGCCLYEALAGKKPFRGDTVTDTIAAIVRAEPEWREVPPKTPRRVQSLLRRCLHKDPEKRLRDLGDARLDLEDAPEEIYEVSAPRPSRLLPAMALAGAVVVAFLLGRWMSSSPSEATAPGRFAIELPPGTGYAIANNPMVAISPDGFTIAFVAIGEDGEWRLYVRERDRFEANLVEGTEGANGPFFSPDGEWLGYFARRELYKVSLATGAVVTLAGTGFSPRGGTWTEDDTIYFNFEYARGLYRVPSSGGDPEPVTVPDYEAGEKTHRFPAILPGGRALLFIIGTSTMSSYDGSRIAVLDLETGDIETLLEGGSQPRYLDSGHLIYSRDGSLMAVPFDVERLEIVGTARKVLDGLVTSHVFGSAQYAISETGMLVYAPGSPDYENSVVQLIDRDGDARALPLDPVFYQTAVFSPDGRRLALWRDRGNAEIWVYDLERSVATRLVTGWDNQLPIWHPDGEHITFTIDRGGTTNVYSVAADGSGGPERLFEEKGDPSSWSPNGHELVFGTSDLDVKAWNPATDEIRTILSSRFNEGGAVVSPDGRWLAYGSNASGRRELYVTSFPEPGGRWQVSAGGAEAWPVWSRDGRKLFYREEDRIMEVVVRPGTDFETGPPQTLFEIRGLRRFDAAPDGNTFVTVSREETRVTHLNVVLGFADELPPG